MNHVLDFWDDCLNWYEDLWDAPDTWYGRLFLVLTTPLHLFALIFVMALGSVIVIILAIMFYILNK